jgi:hypothetical protein
MLMENYPEKLRRTKSGRELSWCWERNQRPAAGLHISEGEALALVMVRDLCRDMIPPKLWSDLSGLFQRSKNYLSSPDQFFARNWLHKVRARQEHPVLLAPACNEPIHETVQEALYCEQQIKVQYVRRGENEPHEYVLHPLALLLERQTIYLVAHTDASEKTKLFALHRIRQARILNEQAHCGWFDLERYLSEKKPLAFGGSNEPICLQLHVTDANSLTIWRETPFSTKQTIAPHSEEGWILTADDVLWTEALEQYLMVWWESAEILAPTELADAVAERLGWGDEEEDDN